MILEKEIGRKTTQTNMTKKSLRFQLNCKVKKINKENALSLSCNEHKN